VSSHFAPAVTQLHTAEYQNPDQLPGGKTLVVGAGNSGLQIALELSRTREVHLAVGTRQKTVPQRPLGRDLFWWLTRTGLITRPTTSPIAAWFRKRGGDLVIGTTWADIEAARIAVHPRLTGGNGRVATFEDASRIHDLSAVVWATGYRPDYPWLDGPDVWDGTRVHHDRGRTAVPGLWFIGLPWQHTRGSALLGFVGEDAAWLADQVAKSADRTAV
jgi:putative flavoprotein involved in K+ transport